MVTEKENNKLGLTMTSNRMDLRRDSSYLFQHKWFQLKKPMNWRKTHRNKNL